MKKVISVTLGGVIFMIEEDALQKLSSYLDAIKAHYGADGKEIVSDIEASIAEKFKAKDASRAIAVADVEEIIAVMGTVEQMAGAEERAEDKAGADAEGDEKKVKRLYRDESNAILGGVCTGLASYFATDVVIVRLIFVALTIINGVGILIYIIMWLIVPVAKTSVQKLEMQGEPINLKNIEEVVKEKAEKVGEAGKKAFVSLKENKSVFMKIVSLPIVIIEAMIKVLRAIGRVILPVIRVALGLFFLIGAFIGLVSSSIMAALFLFRHGALAAKTDFPVEAIAGTKAYAVTILSGYSMSLVFVAVAFIIAISILARRWIMNWTIAVILFALLAVNVTVISVYGFDLATQGKSVYDGYIAEHTIEKKIDIAGFDSISGSAPIRLIVEKAPEYSILATGLDRDIEGIEFVRKDQGTSSLAELEIREVKRERRHGTFDISQPVDVLIKTPSLKKLDVYRFRTYDLKGFGDEMVIENGSHRRDSVSREEIVGGDRDEYGCILSAGYSWCEALSECVRPWEKDCASDMDFTEDGKVVKTDGSSNGEGLYLEYAGKDGKEKFVRLTFDIDSLCGPEGRDIPCMALSVSDYGIASGAEISVTGLREGDAVKVLRLRIK